MYYFRFDLAHFKYEHFREIYSSHAKAILAIPLYIAVFCLHQSTMKFDDKLSLLNYKTNETMLLNVSIPGGQFVIDFIYSYLLKIVI